MEFFKSKKIPSKKIRKLKPTLCTPVIQPNGVFDLHVDIPEAEEVVRRLRRPRDLRRPREPEDEEVQHQPVVLVDERSELQAADQAVGVGVVHVLVVEHHVVLAGHVVRDVVVHDQPQQTGQQGEICWTKTGRRRLRCTFCKKNNRIDNFFQLNFCDG